MADADFLYGGAEDVKFQQPSSVRAALAAAAEQSYPLTPAQRELDAKLAALGVEISNVSYPSCPTGPDQWIKTNSVWTKCEEKMGMRWRTPEGWCYPESMCSIDDVDAGTKTLAAYRKVELYQRIQGALNALRQPQRDVWLQKKSEEYLKYKTPIKLSVANAAGDGYDKKEYSNKDGASQMPLYNSMSAEMRQAFYDVVRVDMPASIKDLPTAALMKQQHDMYADLKAKAKAKTKSEGKEAQVKKLMAAMRSSGVVPEEGMDLEAYASDYYDKAVACADASIGKRYSAAKDACDDDVKYKDADGADKTAECEFFDYGDEEDAMCMPEALAERKDKWLKGEADELAGWYGELFDDRSRVKAADSVKISRALGTRARVF